MLPSCLTSSHRTPRTPETDTNPGAAQSLQFHFISTRSLPYFYFILNKLLILLPQSPHAPTSLPARPCPRPPPRQKRLSVLVFPLPNSPSPPHQRPPHPHPTTFAPSAPPTFVASPHPRVSPQKKHPTTHFISSLLSPFSANCPSHVPISRALFSFSPRPGPLLALTPCPVPPPPLSLPSFHIHISPPPRYDVRARPHHFPTGRAPRVISRPSPTSTTQFRLSPGPSCPLIRHRPSAPTRPCPTETPHLTTSPHDSSITFLVPRRLHG